MKVSCEHTPLLTTGITAVPVQPRIPHLADLFPRLIPFHTFLPNFSISVLISNSSSPFQVSFAFFRSVYLLSPKSLLTSGQSQISSQPLVWHCSSTSQPQVLSLAHWELPSPPGSLLQACWGFLFAFPSAFPPINYRLAQCHAKAAGSGNCREKPPQAPLAPGCTISIKE